MSRLARDLTVIPGVGGFLKITRWAGRTDSGEDGVVEPEATDQLYEGAILEISKWSVRHFYNWADVTSSGSNGSLQRALVSQHFTFEATVPWNAREVPSRLGVMLEAVGFLEEILVGQASANWNVAILFTLGDGLAYPTIGGVPGIDRRAVLHAPSVLVSEVETICDSTGTDIIRLLIRGEGNSLIRGFRGLDIQFNSTTTEDPAGEVPPG